MPKKDLVNPVIACTPTRLYGLYRTAVQSLFMNVKGLFSMKYHGIAVAAAASATAG